MMQSNFSRSGGGRSGGYQKSWSEKTAHEEILIAFGENFETRILSPNQHGYNDYVNRLKDYVDKHVKGITSSQLRNVYALIREKTNPDSLPHIRPRLAYVAGRANNDELRTLIYLLDLLSVRVDDKAKLKNFKSFFESVIAYHKYFGGNDNA
jgi:CRISPR-associated protein Csm2